MGSLYDQAQTRILLVGADQDWTAAVRSAGSTLGAAVDTRRTVKEAIARLLQPRRPYSHVLAQGNLDRRSIDALAGLLDEVTRQPAFLILLGEEAGSNTVVPHVAYPDAMGLLEAMATGALNGNGNGTSAHEPDLTAPQVAASLHNRLVHMRFQPIVGAVDLEPDGLESLARLHHPDRGIVHPGNFIPQAMDNGMERVLSGVGAARTMLELRGLQCPPGMFVSVNLPVETVLHPEAVARATKLCAIAGAKPENIVIEVLETPEAPDYAALTTALQAWHQAGFRTAIDDAGPNLPHWRRMIDLPFDILKLDGVMVADPAHHRMTAEIVSAARKRGLFVVAEGIENEQIMTRMQELGVDGLQGFFVCRPLPGMAIPVWLDQKRPGALPEDPAQF